MQIIRLQEATNDREVCWNNRSDLFLMRSVVGVIAHTALSQDKETTMRVFAFIQNYEHSANLKFDPTIETDR
jgi:hypothetical protein